MQRSVISLIAGVVLAIVAIGLLSLYVSSLRGHSSADAGDMGKVVLATNDLSFGQKLTPRMLRIVRWPVSSIPKDAFDNPQEILAGPDGNNRVALRPISRGEPILKSAISGFSARATMSREVAPGMRAIAIRINDVSGVAGFILPGDRVDVMLTRKLKDEPANDGLVTDVILQDVVVLGVNQLSSQERDKPVVARTVTVQVTQQQAQKLALAQEAGSLSLALRNVDTTGEERTTRVDAGDLADIPRSLPQHHESGPIVIYGMGH
jgi:pilus assembly protein CpaB